MMYANIIVRTDLRGLFDRLRGIMLCGIKGYKSNIKKILFVRMVVSPFKSTKCHRVMSRIEYLL